jgi:hypothetical protein
MDTDIRLFPIGMPGFADICRIGHVYVDKTARVHGLITGSGGQFSRIGGSSSGR